MAYDVTIDRNKYIGGSDIPIIMGISTFKTRFNLLLEKAGLQDDDFNGNQYTEYGNILEPQIRDYINRNRTNKFEPNRVIDGDTRYHSDGFNNVDCVLEIKTTSHIYETVDEYKIYLVQLLFGMQQNKVKKGKLAVYNRPDDFDTEFDPSRLKEYDIKLSEYKTLLNEVNAEIDRFRADLQRLKDNPLLTEEDFQPNELVTMSNKLLALENRMAEFNVIKKQYDEMKKALFDAMEKHNIKKWETLNGTKITRVDGIEASVEIVTEFDLETFKAENPTLYELYLTEVEKKKAGRSGYVKITLPK